MTSEIEMLQKEASELDELATQKRQEISRLEAAAQEMIDTEADAPEWLKKLIVVIADQLGITPKEFRARLKIVHPTPADPVLLIDERPVVGWV